MIRLARVVVHPLSVLLLASLVSVTGLAACDKKDDATPPVQATSTASASASVGVSASASSASTATAPSAAPSTATAPSASAAAAISAAPAHSAGAKPSAQASASAAPGPVQCGTKPQPDCPLQAWMKANANPAVASGDTAKLGEVLEKMSKFGPAGYSNWSAISMDGSKAAKAGNLDAAKASCRTCHDQYKAKYRAEVRDRKI